MSKSPSGESSVFKRSASHSLRSSFRLPKKRNNVQVTTCSSLPTALPRKAAALLDLSFPPSNGQKNIAGGFKPEANFEKLPEPLKIATIRKRSVWANSSASKINS